MSTYLSIINALNGYVEEFNSYLRPEYSIPLLDLDEINNSAYFLNLSGKKWNDFYFPRNLEVGGVYFYMGKSESVGKEIGVYIGKSSLKSTIGGRLWVHLRKSFYGNKAILTFNKESFIIELITSIPIENTSLTFLAPALEEYLITRFQVPGCKLLNTQGNNK